MARSDATGISLVGGVLALDFTNTMSGRGTEAEQDHLDEGSHLVDWARHAGVIDPLTADRCAEAIMCNESAARRLLQHALELRDAIYRIGVAIAHSDIPPRTCLATLKEFARSAVGSADLTPVPGGNYGFDFSRGTTEAALLGPIAWSAIDLLATKPLDRIKQCPGEGCLWLFLDSSKNNSRRWCDMSSCGNRSKARRHRQRQ